MTLTSTPSAGAGGRGAHAVHRRLFDAREEEDSATYHDLMDHGAAGPVFSREDGFSYEPLSVRPGRLSGLSVLYSESILYDVWYGRGGRLTVLFGGFRPGQWCASVRRLPAAWRPAAGPAERRGRAQLAALGSHGPQSHFLAGRSVLFRIIRTWLVYSRAACKKMTSPPWLALGRGGARAVQETEGITRRARRCCAHCAAANTQMLTQAYRHHGFSCEEDAAF
jgi:hypothetical protein